LTHTVLVWDKPQEVSTCQKSKSVWIAVGEYMGVRIKAKGIGEKLRDTKGTDNHRSAPHIRFCLP
jgi:hypothetical protein